MLSTTFILALVFTLPAAVRGTQYGMVKEYAGSSFFDDWNFYGSCELQISSEAVLPHSSRVFSRRQPHQRQCLVRARVLRSSRLFLNTRISFVTASQASKQKLAFVNSAGNAIIKVDNTTNNLQINQDRNSVNIATKDYFAMGSVWIADMLHVPYGVGHLFFFC
jgi:hypothetical protein